MPNVFIVQDNGRYNLTSAQSFGELKTLLPTRMQLQLDAGEAVTTLSDKLVEFNDEDSLLCIGDPAAIGIAIAIATFYNSGRVNILKFDRQANSYYRLEVDLTQFFEAPSIEVDTTPSLIREQ